MKDFFLANLSIFIVALFAYNLQTKGNDFAISFMFLYTVWLVLSLIWWFISPVLWYIGMFAWIIITYILLNSKDESYIYYPEETTSHPKKTNAQTIETIANEIDIESEDTTTDTRQVRKVVLPAKKK